MQVVLGETAARLRVVPDAPRACGAAHQLGWHQPRALEGACYGAACWCTRHSRSVCMMGWGRGRCRARPEGPCRGTSWAAWGATAAVTAVAGPGHTAQARCDGARNVSRHLNALTRSALQVAADLRAATCAASRTRPHQRSWAHEVQQQLWYNGCVRVCVWGVHVGCVG